MKKLLSLILVFVFVIGVCFSAPFTLKAKAASVSDLTFELNEDGQSYSVSDCVKNASGKIVIPATYNDLPVTRIGSSAFVDCWNLTSITIPDSVTSIGYSAFSDCSNLNAVYISDLASWCNIDFAHSDNYVYDENYFGKYSNPLYYARNLYLNGELVTDLVIPENVTEIKRFAFYNCTALTSVTIPDSVTSIGDWAFYDCNSLTSITISDSVTSIGYDAFCNTAYYNNSDNWENDVIYIGNHLIKAKDTLSGDYVIKEGTKCIAGNAFRYCNSLTSITIPSSVRSIGYFAFSYCNSLTSVNITDLVAWCNINFVYNYIDTLYQEFREHISNPLYYAKKLYLNGELVTDLVIPDGVTEINDYAFYGCSTLKSVTIPDSVKSIGKSAFSYCNSLTSVNITDLIAWYNMDFANNYYQTLNTYYGSRTVYNISNPLYYAKNLYLKGNLVTEFIIPNGITEIKRGAFCGWSSLTSVTIPNSVTSIGDYAFDGCSSLTSITIPDSVTSIGSCAFKGCSTLKSVTIPDSVTSIGENAFAYCDSLISITIPDGVTSIGSGAFKDCSSLTGVTIPDSVTSIGEYAFAYCDSLISVNITNISSWCNIDFDNASSNPLSYAENLCLNGELVTDLAIPEGVTEIKKYAFYSCSTLKSVTIPDSVTSIGEDAFAYCDSLISITIPDGVTSIGSCAFKGCSSLTGVTIPDSVTSIGSSVFYNCDSLISVNITNISSWCNIDFDNSSSNPLSYAENLCLNGELVTDLAIPEGVTEIKKYAFYSCSTLESVTIPDSVTSIDSSTFENCSSLASVTIGKSLTNISSLAFTGCESLASMNVSNENNYYSSENGILFNKNKTELILYPKGNSTTSLIIPDGVTSIGDRTFYGSSSLVSVTIPDSVTSIGEYAFAYCDSLTNITIGSGVTNMDPYTFAYCDLLASVTICEGVTRIGVSAFKDCSSLTSITIPDSVTSIGEDAFYNCSNLNAVYISDIASWCNIKFNCSTLNFSNQIPYGGYSSCCSLVHYFSNPLYYTKELYLNGELVTDLVIPEGVTEIKQGAFYGCSSLTSVTIPDSVTTIGDSAFSDCYSLKSVHISDLTAWCELNFAANQYQSTCSYHYTNYPAGWRISNPLYYAKNLYLNGELVTELVIPDSVTKINNDAFYGCSTLKSVTIPDSVTTIGGSAFSDCYSLKSVTIPDSVTSIGGNAFFCNDYSSLTSVNITDISAWCNIDFVSRDANPLYYAENLYLNGELVTDLVIPDGVTEIKKYAFFNCDSLTSVTIGDSVTSIGEYAFAYCYSLTSITIPDSVTSIGSDAFYNCESLTSVNITDLAAWCNIDFKYSYANPLYYANKLYLNGELVTDLVIPEGVTEIKNYAYYNCTSLTSVIIPDGVKNIRYYAFENCTSLTSVTIPDSVTSIGYYAFNNCPSLKYVFYTGSSDDWSNISIDSGNESLTAQPIHYNSTDHSHNVTTRLPISADDEGVKEDICPVCDFVNSTEKLVWLNDYIAAVDTKDVVVDTTSNTLLLDISASKDLDEAIIKMDGYTLNTTPNSDFGYFGTGSKVQVKDTNGTQVAEYTLVVRGDVNGDSVCDVLDCMLIELARTNNRNLDGVYLSAGDLAENGVIDDDDFNAVVNKAIAS